MTQRVSPLVQMTMALVALACTLVMLGAMFFDAIPDRDASRRVMRQAVADALAVQLAEQLVRESPREIEKTLRQIAARTHDLRSVGVRRADGTLVVDSGGHPQTWPTSIDDRSLPHRITVPLNARDERWGRIELAFTDTQRHPVIAFVMQPLVQLLAFVTVAGWLVFGLYMRRALQHLDPSSVVPERVQGAFDAMAEGIVVLDARAQVMMCNKALRALHPDLEKITVGTRMAALPWLGDALPADAAEHPWSRAMAERSANAGTVVDAGVGDACRRLTINAAPISDAGGAVRGCMVTVSDMTELHRAHDALRVAVTQLETSKQEVDRKNAELERLATRDPLTGALNRRAFHAAFDALAAQARGAGRSLACLVIDIDHFKAINDHHGHGIGDRVIQELARRLHDSARATDLVCRWGGEEFCVVVAGLDTAATAELAERVRLRIERECGAAIREVAGLRVTASIGVAFASSAVEALNELVDKADQALYRAKRAGRNRVAMPMADLPSTEPSTEPHHDEPIDPASGCLNARGWLLAQQRLRETARSDDRALACLVVALDRVSEAAEQAAAGATGQRLASPIEQRAATTVAQWLREGSPLHAAVARIDERSAALMVAGASIEDCLAVAKQLARRVKHELAAAVEGGEGTAFTLSIGIDALPAASPAATMLAERAAQAAARVRRSGGNAIALFAAQARAQTAPAAQASSTAPGSSTARASASARASPSAQASSITRAASTAKPSSASQAQPDPSPSR